MFINTCIYTKAVVLPFVLLSLSFVLKSSANYDPIKARKSYSDLKKKMYLNVFQRKISDGILPFLINPST